MQKKGNSLKNRQDYRNGRCIIQPIGIGDDNTPWLSINKSECSYIFCRKLLATGSLFDLAVSEEMNIIKKKRLKITTKSKQQYKQPQHQQQSFNILYRVYYSIPISNQPHKNIFTYNWRTERRKKEHNNIRNLCALVPVWINNLLYVFIKKKHAAGWLSSLDMQFKAWELLCDMERYTINH